MESAAAQGSRRGCLSHGLAEEAWGVEDDEEAGGRASGQVSIVQVSKVRDEIVN